MKNGSRVRTPPHHKEMHRLAAAALAVLLLLIPVVSGALTHSLASLVAGGMH